MNILKYRFYQLESKIKINRCARVKPDNYYVIRRKCAGRKIMRADETGKLLYDEIKSGNPFFAGKVGASEQYCCNVFEFGLSENEKSKAIRQLCEWSGFFPNSILAAEQFTQVMKNAIHEVDLFGIWNMVGESYYVHKFLSADAKLTYMDFMRPWRTDRPWTEALKGKKVLVIHPFENSIQGQYEKREELFKECKNGEMLPEFELQTLKAVQTIAGEKDERFGSWFDALDYMVEEVQKREFDIALIGCGAYGFPLGAAIKRMGKQAIHLGGATQILFGILGKRWEDDKNLEKYYNSFWVRPSEEERPKNLQNVENGCYW